MKTLLILSLTIFSMNVYSQTTKAVKAIVSESARINKAKKMTDEKNAVEVPCDSKEDILKKLEEKKKASVESGKGFSLQGKTDTGCTIK